MGQYRNDIDNKVVDDLLRVAVYVSPTGKEQQSFGSMVNSMQITGSSNKEIAIALSGAIYDGLKKGNWPA